MRLASMLPALTTLALSSLGGCIIYEKDVIHQGGGGGGGECGRGEDCDDWGWYDTAGGDTGGAEGEGEGEVETLWSFAPNTLAPGETRILSLTADPIFDYLTITEVALYGDASVCAIDVRDDEVLVTASALQDAADGTVNALIITADGDGIWVPDALSIVGGADANGDGSDGADGSGGSGGSDGSDPTTGDGSDPTTGDGSGGDGSGGSSSGGGCG